MEYLEDYNDCPCKMWLEFSPYQTVQECIDETGEAYVYMGSDIYIFPNGDMVSGYEL